jgi:hypothetical protein
VKRAFRTPLIVAVTAATALGGTVYAYAGWTMDTTPTTLRIHVAAMPAGNTPSIEQRADKAILRWVPNKIVPGVPAQSYVVTRHGGGAAVEVCKVTTATCNEVRVPGGTWSWTVRPIFATWIGAESAPTRDFLYSDPAKPTVSAAQTLVFDSPTPGAVDSPTPGNTGNKAAAPAPAAAAAESLPIKPVDPVPADAAPSSSAPTATAPSPQESLSSNPTIAESGP